MPLLILFIKTKFLCATSLTWFWTICSDDGNSSKPCQWCVARYTFVKERNGTTFYVA